MSGKQADAYRNWRILVYSGQIDIIELEFKRCLAIFGKRAYLAVEDKRRAIYLGAEMRFYPRLLIGFKIGNEGHTDADVGDFLLTFLEPVNKFETTIFDSNVTH